MAEIERLIEAVNEGDVARVKALLEEESPLPYLFDIVDYHTIETPAFKEHIDKHGKSIYKRN